MTSPTPRVGSANPAIGMSALIDGLKGIRSFRLGIGRLEAPPYSEWIAWAAPTAVV